MTLLPAVTLFSCGILACLAWSSGLYACCALATAAPLWIMAAALWQQPRQSTTSGGPDLRLPIGGPDPETERRRWQSMLDQTPAPLLTIGTDDVPVAANRAARRLFRTDDRVRLQPALQAAIASVAPGERAVVKLTGDEVAGRARQYALSVANSVGLGGALRLVVLTDIEAELQAAEAAALRDLLHVLSHEIMNSLTPVTSLAESVHALLVGGRVEDMPAAAEALETILRRSAGLNRFVRGYRMLARVPSPDLRPSSVRELLEHVVILFSSRWSHVALELCLPEPDIIVRIDLDQLTQALLNLLANAAEASLEDDTRMPQVKLDAVGRSAGLEIRVTDSGRGVAPADAEAIFAPFFTSKKDGTGIGLGLARQIVRSHGGELLLERNSTECGATFLLRL